MVTFNSSINKVAEEKEDSILSIVLLALISEKVVLIFNPDCGNEICHQKPEYS